MHLVRAHPERFGYLLEDGAVDVGVLVQAMHTILAGGTVLDPAVVSHLIGNSGLADQLDRLSARERELLELHRTADEHRRVLAVLAWLRT